MWGGHKYKGKPTQLLGDRMKQHIPDYLVQLASPTAPPVRLDRGRPPSKQPTADTCAREVRKTERIKATRSSPPNPLTTIRPEMVEGKSNYAITKHVKFHRIACEVFVVIFLVTLVL